MEKLIQIISGKNNIQAKRQSESGIYIEPVISHRLPVYSTNEKFIKNCGIGSVKVLKINS